MKNTIQIYTDGACFPNPGRGGWACLLLYKDFRKIIYGSDLVTTNNKMEIMAAIEGLKAITDPNIPVEVFTDSHYLRGGVEKWRTKWVSKNWMKSGGKPVKNKELWLVLYSLIDNLKVNFNWVPGHSGHKHNEYVDRVSKQAARHQVPRTEKWV